MSSGHASHKGTSVKPNTNANDRLDTAADLNVAPEDLLQEGADAHRADEAGVNPAAVERPPAIAPTDEAKAESESSTSASNSGRK